LGAPSYAISSTSLTVRLGNDANGYVIADAIRIERLGDLPPATVVLVDDGDAGFSGSAGFINFSGQGYQNDVTFAAAGSGSETATWTFTGLAAGTYRVSATWTAHANRATNAPFTVFDGPVATGTDLGTVLVNQEPAPNHFTANGASWFNLGGPYTVNSGTLTVRLTDNANEYVIADAIRIEQLTADPVTIIDDGDVGFTATGGFVNFGGQGYQSDVTFAAAGSGTESATWTFAVVPGVYRVSVTWTAHPNRATNAPYTVLDGTTSLGTFAVNQEAVPGDFSYAGVSWQDLGSGVFTIMGTTLVVQLTDAANEFVIADAVRIERLA
jgi:hypothetical protein